MDVHGPCRSKTRPKVVHTDHEEVVGVDRFTGPNHVVPPAFAFILTLVNARHMVRCIERVANQYGIRFVGVERAISFIRQVVVAQARTTLQAKRVCKVHGLRNGNHVWRSVRHEKVKTL